MKSAVALLAVVTASRLLAAADPALPEILARSGAYVVNLQRTLSGIVAEEDYVQDVKSSSLLGTNRGVVHRELKSDLLLVRPVGSDHWVQFRDVFEVDGQAVRDRNERLMKLFVAPSSSTASQADLIARESSRYNIGNLQRTVNVPVLALAILDPVHQQRFRFEPSKKGGPPPVRSAAAAATSVLVVDYHEVEPRTIIRAANDRDMPVRGRFWIEPETGRVFGSEMIAQDPEVRGVVTVGYDVETSLGAMVPVEMHEQYELTRGRTLVLGTATYSRFRQFQVKVDEKIAPVK